MAKPPTISDAEWDVMQVLWDTSPLTANEVVERVSAKKARNPRTVKTLLNRLVNKGALGFAVEGKRYWYSPRVSRDECVRNESRSFLDRVFSGALGPMLAHFVNETPLTADEIVEVRRIIERRQRKGK